MKKIYTGIDIGSREIKIVTMEKIEESWKVLARTAVKSKGVKKGWISNKEQAKESLEEALKEQEETLGVPIEEALVAIPSYGRNLTITSGEVDLPNGKVEYEDIIKCLQDAVLGKIPEGRELVTVFPIVFTLGEEGYKNPIGQSGDSMIVKAVVATVPKEVMTMMQSLFHACGVEIVDIAFHEIGDYDCTRNKDYDSKVGAMIDIGYDTTKVAVFNKGIMIKDEIIEMGSHQIDRDLKEAFAIPSRMASYIKERFAVSNKRYADINDTMEIVTKDGSTININQLNVSEIVEARLTDLLRLAKKQITILTNREISYIIITGGISELAGFQYLVENVLGRVGTTLTIHEIGIRENKYSSAAGIIKYFDEKLKLRGKSYSMMSEAKEESIMAPRNKQEKNGETIINRVFGYFFDNN